MQLRENHRSFLLSHNISTEQLQDLNPDDIPLDIQKDLRVQLAHNLTQGILTHAGADQFRYSWRGLFFIWVQFLRDLVRFS